MLTDADRAWVALHQTPELTPKILRCLLSAYADPEHIFALSTNELTAIGLPEYIKRILTNCRRSITGRGTQDLQQNWRVLDELDIRIVPIGDKDYPELLKQLSDPPPLLYVRGNKALLNQPQLAMVGSRKPSHQGCDNAVRIASELAAAGFTITSGLAQGIDSCSHRGALNVSGNTIAVLGTGVDRIYPLSNRSLYDEIIKRGAIVSEFYLGSEPRREHFPQRNRIISGLSLGVLVVEAAIKSGSLISARCALEQNREVFAIPGSILNPVSKGCHELIRQGAKLVETAADIVEELQGWTLPPAFTGNTRSRDRKPISVQLEPDERKLMAMLGHDPASVETLLHRSGWTMPVLSALLTQLELKGLIDKQSGIIQRIAQGDKKLKQIP